MQVVEIKDVREILEFRVKSLRACEEYEIAALVERDLKEIATKSFWSQDDHNQKR